ncbi:unnamed protein product [Absidia cylindrospora]
MTNKMPSHVRPLVTAPRLNYRQSTIMTTPVDKSSLSNSGMETVEPYCAAQQLERSMVTNSEDANDSTSTCSPLYFTKDPHSLLLKKATSKSSMNLTSLLDNCGTLRQEDIIPRSTKSEPYITTLPSQQNQNDDHWNEHHYHHDKKDDTNHDDEERVNDSKWNILQSRLLDIITTTIHQELERHYQSTMDDTSSQQHQTPMTPKELDDTFCKNDRSTTYSTGAPSPFCVSQWWQQRHVALEKLVADQHQECTKTMELLEQRIHVLEQRHQQQEQQIQNCQKQETRDEKTVYDALHERYMDLVTQHSHQLERYEKLQQIHHSQSLALKQRHQKIPHPPTNTVTTTSLPSPPQPPIDNLQITNTGYPHKRSKDVNAATPFDQQTHHTHRHEHRDMVSAPMVHHQPNLVSVAQKPKTYHLQNQQSSMLPTPNASPTATQLASPTHSPADLTTTTMPRTGRHSILPPPLPSQQQNQSVKMDNGYVEFMTECNGQHVLCRVKLPKDADADKGNTSTTKHNKNTKTIPNPSTLSRRTYSNNHYQPHYQSNNIKNNKTRGQSPTHQRYQQQQTQQQKHPYHHTRQPQPQQQPHQEQHQHQHPLPRHHIEQQTYPHQQPHHHYHHHQHHHQYQYQHQQYQKYKHPMHTSHHPSITNGDIGKALNPNAPAWSGSWNKHLQLQYH